MCQSTTKKKEKDGRELLSECNLSAHEMMPGMKVNGNGSRGGLKLFAPLQEGKENVFHNVLVESMTCIR